MERAGRAASWEYAPGAALLVALKRMAELVDEGQERGEIEGHGGARNFKVPRQDVETPATLTDLGITRQRLHEARKLRPLSALNRTGVGSSTPRRF